MTKFLHTSDWQIGMKGGGLGEAGALVARQRIETIERIFEVAESEKVDFILACGDLFEHNQVADDQVTAVARILRAHPSVEIHAIPGNHDLPGPGSVWNRVALRAVPNLHVHVHPGTVPVPVRSGEVVVLHPFPVRSRYSLGDPLATLESVADDPRIQIGLAHGHITTATFGAHEADIKLPIKPSHVDRAGLDYLALGHCHSTQLIKTANEYCRIAYSGTHEQTSYAERDAGNVLIVSIAEKGARPEIRPVRVAQFQWDRRELNFASDENVDRLRELLAGCNANFLEITMTGELPDRLYADYRAALGDGNRFKNLRVNDSTLRWLTDSPDVVVPPTDASLANAQRRLAERVTLTTDGDAAVLREAMGLFNRYVAEANP